MLITPTIGIVRIFISTYVPLALHSSFHLPLLCCVIELGSLSIFPMRTNGESDFTLERSSVVGEPPIGPPTTNVERLTNCYICKCVGERHSCTLTFVNIGQRPCRRTASCIRWRCSGYVSAVSRVEVHHVIVGRCWLNGVIRRIPTFARIAARTYVASRDA